MAIERQVKILRIGYKKAFFPLLCFIVIASTFTIYSTKASTNEIQKNGVIDCISEIDIKHDNYSIEDTIVLNKNIISKENAYTVLNGYNKNGYNATISENGKYYKIITNKEIPFSQLSNITNLCPIGNFTLKRVDGVDRIEGNLDENLLYIPQTILNKYADNINITLKMNIVTKVIDSTGVINGNSVYFTYKPGTTNYINITFNEPFIFNLPLVQVKSILQLCVYILAVIALIILGILIKKLIRLLINNKDSCYMDDVTFNYEYSNNAINYCVGNQSEKHTCSKNKLTNKFYH